MPDDKCPKCGAEHHRTIRDGWLIWYECGTRIRADDGSVHIEDTGCLRRQLAQARAENERLAAEHQQCHDTNNELVAEHAVLKARIAELEGREGGPQESP